MWLTRGDDEDAAFIKVPNVMSEEFGLQADILERARINRKDQQKDSSGDERGEMHETVAYR